MVAAQQHEIDPADARYRMCDQEIAAHDGDLRVLNVIGDDTARDVSEWQVTDRGDQRPNQDFGSGVDDKAANGDHDQQHRYGECAARHGLAVQFQQFAFKIRIARLLRQLLTRLAHSARDIAVAAHIRAVHNVLVGQIGPCWRHNVRGCRVSYAE
jgi:hypothetical protein